MTQAYSLYKTKTQAELLKLQEQIHSDPACANTDGGIYLYNAKARKKLSAIAQAISWHLEDKRAAAGKPVSKAGYSGLRQNRR